MALISDPPSDQVRRRINASKNRSQKLRRKSRKLELIESRGGRCQDCGYFACVTALEFHHRDASSKRFAVGNFAGALTRLKAEVEGCGFDGLAAVFEFHHLDPAQKEFGITQDGIPHRWDKVVAELAKCVMLCANCHREVHAGVRELFDDGLLGLAEPGAAYAA